MIYDCLQNNSGIILTEKLVGQKSIIVKIFIVYE